MGCFGAPIGPPTILGSGSYTDGPKTPLPQKYKYLNLLNFIKFAIFHWNLTYFTQLISKPKHSKLVFQRSIGRLNFYFYYLYY
jgi:hypothetical protein